ncbi:MAG: hypothetical protein HPY50_18945 [Firmicutes bacterium]|nr:hypothetical protein [Bacillota bacterium]
MSVSFMMLNLAAILLVILFLYTLRVKNKGQYYYVFQAMCVSMIVWTVGSILSWYYFITTGEVIVFFVKLWFLGNCFLPVLLFLASIMFKNDRLRLTWKHSLLFLPATISYITLLTNEVNGGLFFRNIGLFNSELIYGPVLYFHVVFSYLFLIIGFYNLLAFTVRNTGLFSRQSSLMLIGAICPFLLNVVITLRIANLPLYYTPIFFTITLAMLYLSIVRYRFLNMTPMATQTILDRMTDGYAVTNDSNEVVHFNRAFQENFMSTKPKLADNLYQILEIQPGMSGFVDNLRRHAQEVESLGQPFSFDQELKLNGEARHFQVDITPIYVSDMHVLWGKLFFFKDTTQIHKAIETINRNQAMLMEQQHLASLGQLIGGIAHNLRTPIMSIAGALEALRDLVTEYQISIGDRTVTDDDHKEISNEMLSWINKTKPFCSYMSEVISAVKDQAVRLSDSSMSKFTVSEFLKRIEILMKFELRRHHCFLNIDNQVPPETEVLGTMNNLIQIVGNIISNAIEAYEDVEGQIDLVVEPCSLIPQNIRLTIRDYGPGIPEEVQERIFKEMTTTKGKKGTGLGLYLSYITIKGKFGGNMWIDSSVGNGTSLYISVPRL